MKRAGEKSSTKLGLVIAALVTVVVLVAGFIFFNPFGGTKSSGTAKKQLEQAQPSKKLNMNQVKKKKIT